MNNIQPTVLKDFYKADHRNQYPDKTQFVYSNMTSRSDKHFSASGIGYTVVAGIQYLCKEYLINQWNEGFFNQPKDEIVARYKRRMDNALGPDAVDISHIAELHDLGYLPVLIKALPEGTKCPIRVPFLTIVNTDERFYWLTNYLETLISCATWQMQTSATIANEYRKLLDGFAMKTVGNTDFVPFQGHDFSFRGMSSPESACLSGAGHLFSFVGTDTIPAIDFLEQYYGANSDNELVGCSVPATEHSVMCLGGDDNEIGTFKRLITDKYPKGIVSIVSDTWDYWKVLTEYLPTLKSDIMARDGKVVIRPDSGDPVYIICGDPEAEEECVRKGSIEVLWDVFGGTVNDKGYKELDSHIGLIYGDSITLERCEQICRLLERKGFASTNVVFGIGSYTYQYVTRDTFGSAVKATYGVVDDVPKSIFKDPKTDDGMKKSAKGLLRVNEDLTLSDEVSPYEEEEGLLETVFKDGKIIKEYSLQEIRDRLRS